MWIDEKEVREMFRAAAGWKGLEKLFAFYGCARLSMFCRRRWIATDRRAVELLHQAMAEHG